VAELFDLWAIPWYLPIAIKNAPNALLKNTLNWLGNIVKFYIYLKKIHNPPHYGCIC
jgi:hypothetical protein